MFLLLGEFIMCSLKLITTKQLALLGSRKTINLNKSKQQQNI